MRERVKGGEGGEGRREGGRERGREREREREREGIHCTCVCLDNITIHTYINRYMYTHIYNV